MDALDLARWQFAVTSLFHFLFVPLSIGLAFLVAVMQTVAHRTGKDVYDRMARFWGKLLVLNFALGVVTGIVMEFQFGMNWSAYSRYVGDVFGAPLAVEGLAAFFLESTFLGLWLFGRDRLSKRQHLASIWLVSIGTMISALFILGANAWMQHPVGYEFNAVTGRAEMTDFFAVLTNSTLIASFWHTLFAALATGAMFMLGVSGYHLLRRRDLDVFARSAKIALVTTVVASLGVAFVGHAQAQLMTRQQPMKMAAAEALYETKDGASFSILTIGDLDGDPKLQIRLPNLLSVLATNTWNGRVEGINDVQAAEEARYGAGSYVPNLWLTYWSFRGMVGAGFLMIALGIAGLILMRRRHLEVSSRYLRLLPLAIALPWIANSAGWIFTEVGRQPWVVFGLFRTSAAASPTVAAGTIAASLIGFTLIYAALIAVEVVLMVRFVKAGPPPVVTAPGPAETPALIY